jgi:hypothetical protein
MQLQEGTGQLLAAKLPARTERTTMNTDSLSNPTVKAAIEALQRGDQAAWSALFEPGARLSDNGKPRSLEKFSGDALGHERFTSIDSVRGAGLEVIGGFHSDTWGDFKTYFRFHLSPVGKVERLDVGRAA